MNIRQAHWARIVVGVIALGAVLSPLPFLSASAQAQSCPEDEFTGIQLSNNQRSQLQQLDARFDQAFERIFPISPQFEAQIEQIEERYWSRFEQRLSPQQLQQLEQLAEWAAQESIKIVPEFAQETEAEPTLTAEQERRLDALDEDYERRFQAILTPEQRQQLAALEEQLDAEIEAVEPQPTAEQAAQLEALEEQYEATLEQILTAEQLQQLERNWACEA
ncbi:MAG: hypothetical protein AAGG51_31010 [Cyanobacteria bacterium P01_G01_bin.54]